MFDTEKQDKSYQYQTDIPLNGLERAAVGFGAVVWCAVTFVWCAFFYVVVSALAGAAFLALLVATVKVAFLGG